jgi:hypothetical protein
MTMPSVALSTGVPRVAKISTPWCARPPLRGEPHEFGICFFVTFMTGIRTTDGAGEVMSRANTIG